ncbi:MAG: ADP-ribosylglycohydrolase family protein [Granulosicoccus sp.]
MAVVKMDALRGVLVADAASMGLHWLYDHEQIAAVESTGSLLFRQPDANIFKGRKAYFAHAGRYAGQLSHYGESAWLMNTVCADGSYDSSVHRQVFFDTFGPCGSFVGYADRPTKALVARIITEADDLEDPTGMIDDQMPGLCPVAAIFACGLPRDDTARAVGVISVHQDVLDSALLLHDCLGCIADGMPLKAALKQTATSGSSTIHKLVQEALSIQEYQPLEVAMQFGLACHVPQGMPIVWHILNHVEDFESAVRDNIRCGGDSCGRAMSLGAIAGLAFDIPADMLDAMDATYSII